MKTICPFINTRNFWVVCDEGKLTLVEALYRKGAEPVIYDVPHPCAAWDGCCTQILKNKVGIQFGGAK